MRALTNAIAVLLTLVISPGFADVINGNTVQNGLPVVVPAPIKVIEGQCLLSQICAVDKKTKSDPGDPDKTVTSYFGVLTYRLRNDAAYVIGDGSISRVKEVIMGTETLKSVETSTLANDLCGTREKQISEFYSKCNKKY